MKETIKILLTLVAFIVMSMVVMIFGLIPFFAVLVGGGFVLTFLFLFAFSIYFLVARTTSWIWSTLKSIWREYILMLPSEEVDNY